MPSGPTSAVRQQGIASMTDQGTIELVANELFLLGGVELIDERLSYYPSETFGKYVPYNCYLLRSGGESLLIESGAASHHPVIRAQLQGLVRGSDEFRRLVVTRNEPECNSNIPNLVRDFGIGAVHSLPMMSSLQYFPANAKEFLAAGFDASSNELQMMDFGVRCIPVEEGERILLGGEARLEPFPTPLRVLPTNWFYDRRTRTLFCSDVFCGRVSDTPSVRTNSEILAEDEMTATMLNDLSRKFDWLSRGYLTDITETLENYFMERKIDILAPTRGNPIVGSDAVDANLRALISALKLLNVGVRPGPVGEPAAAVVR